MKQIDYLKLVASARKSIHYARPSDADDALTGLIGICFILSLVLTFGAAVLGSFFGELIDSEMLAWPLAATVLPGIAYMVCGFFIGGAQKLIRYLILTIGAITAIMLSYFAVTGSLDGWYLFIAPFMFALGASIGATKQL